MLRDDGTLFLNYGDAYAGNGTTGRNDSGENTWSGGPVNGGQKVKARSSPNDDDGRCGYGDYRLGVAERPLKPCHIGYQAQGPDDDAGAGGYGVTGKG